MSMATLARNRGLETAMKAVPMAYIVCSKALLGSRAISTVTSPRLIHNQSPPPLFTQKKKNNPSLISPPNANAAFRSFSTDRHLDPYERFARRTGINWGIRFVPQQEAFVIERFGKFHTILEAGLHLLVPLVDQIAYIHSLKEQTIEIPEQPAVTTDNVSIRVNGVLFVKVVDAAKASYGNDNVMYAVTQLAQTVMRCAIGKMPLDKTFMERDTLNQNIVEAINETASQWGLICRRYEIRDIIPPPGIRDSMVMQAEAERKKRAEIIEAEGKRQAVILTSEAAKTDQINRASGQREAIILTSEAAKMDAINRATGQREAIKLTAEGQREATILTSEAAKVDSINRATGQAEAIRIVAEALKRNGGQAAASLKVAEDYVQAFTKMAKKSTTILLPTPVGDASSMVATALALYKNVLVDKSGKQMLQENSTPQMLQENSTPQTLQENSTPAHPTGEVEHYHDGAEEKPVFSLQSPKKD